MARLGHAANVVMRNLVDEFIVVLSGIRPMSSPLLPYANAYLLFSLDGAPTIVDGRYTTTVTATYVVEAYLTRQDSTGVTTGADYIPTQTSPGNTLPGASGVVYLYRGYALRYAPVEAGYDPSGAPQDASLAWVDATDVTWLKPGLTGVHAHGDEPIKRTKVERATGKYGGVAIDQIVRINISGVPITVRSGDVVD
jgi:hypothetical protein